MNYFIYISPDFTAREDKLTLLPMCGFIAQLVEHRTGIAEVMGTHFDFKVLVIFSSKNIKRGTRANIFICLLDHAYINEERYLSQFGSEMIDCSNILGARPPQC